MNNDSHTHKGETWIKIGTATTKEQQSTLKIALKKISNPNSNTKLNIADCNTDNITKFRN